MKPDQVDLAIKRSKTDSFSDITYDPSVRPEISNLVQIFSLCSGTSVNDVVERYQSRGYADFKKSLSEVVNAHLDPIRRKRSEIEKDKHVVREVLTMGNREARMRAQETLEELRFAMHMSIDQYVG